MNLKISVELTFSPLMDDFEEPIEKFIKKLRNGGLTVKENPLSTQVYGDYDLVMDLINTEMKSALSEVDSGLMYMKIVKTDRSDYEPDF
ncbi:MAG: hypothetical protein RI558_09490 [Psychroflexus sp.]|jgi:uncharacterized protein YqgV (UPF0045/DUF77 family)|nr:hypothetical protein [Psychroflexus sp.]MDR9449449.1 hypothetical protein [Psychroflexus sp.]